MTLSCTLRYSLTSESGSDHRLQYVIIFLRTQMLVEIIQYDAYLKFNLFQLKSSSKYFFI